MADKLLRRPDVERMVGLRRAAIYALTARGEFPRPVRIGARAVAWKESDLVAWIASRELAGRDRSRTATPLTAEPE